MSKSERTDNNGGRSYAFELDKPVVIDLVGNYEFNERWKLDARWNVQSGKLYTPIESGILLGVDEDGENEYLPVLGDINSARGELEHSLDLHLEYNRKFAESEVGVYLDILNVYDNNRVIAHVYNEDYTGVEAIENPVGILPLLGVKYSFWFLLTLDKKG